MSPQPATCERCGRSFGCGAGDPDCWCAAVEVSAGVRDTLARTYSSCMCPDCLRALAAADAPD